MHGEKNANLVVLLPLLHSSAHSPHPRFRSPHSLAHTRVLGSKVAVSMGRSIDRRPTHGHQCSDAYRVARSCKHEGR